MHVPCMFLLLGLKNYDSKFKSKNLQMKDTSGLGFLQKAHNRVLVIITSDHKTENYFLLNWVKHMHT